MVYVQVKMGVARNKIKEAWQVYQSRVMEWDKSCVKRVGGKYIGYWYTEYGNTGEITFLVCYPDLGAREKLLELFWETGDEEIKEGIAEWLSYVPHASVKVLRALPGSPLE